MYGQIVVRMEIRVLEDGEPGEGDNVRYHQDSEQDRAAISRQAMLLPAVCQALDCKS